MAAGGGVTTVPVCLLGVDKVRGGLGIGLVEDIMTTRGLLTKEKKSYIAIVSVADGEGTVSPKTRFPSSVVLREGGGMQDDHLAHIMRVKTRSGHLEKERFGIDNDLIDVIRRSVQPGMVIVDQMKKADEAKTLEALEVAEALGCRYFTILIPQP
ncbi:hypothetical protein BJ742DRAFT_99391 [Cladochytrium replicatum]|nr:hypothetical protein BJ742DRAFT_99391 [Cladochytrium replicatum]